MKLSLGGRSSWAVVGVLMTAGVALLAFGALSLLGGGDDGPKPFGTLTPTPFIAATATPTPTPVATATATPVPTPTPSNAAIARMVIEKLGVDAAVQVKGVDENYVMEVPDTPHLVAWYDFTGYPGYGKNAVFSAHVDWYPNIRGAFWGLNTLEQGDVVKVILEDGTEYQYKVTTKVLYDADNAPMDEILEQNVEKEVVTLITCGGRFVKDSNGLGSYLDRWIVRAERVDAGEPLRTASSSESASAY